MPLAWTKAEAGAKLGVYAEWERAASQSKAPLWWTFFLERETPPTKPEHVDEILDQTDHRDITRPDPRPDISQQLVLPDEEALWLLRVRKLLAAGGTVATLRATVELTEDIRDRVPSGWRLLHVGPPTQDPSPRFVNNPGNWVKNWPLPSEADGIPILGLIDDGLAYLNARFRATPKSTRVAAVWRQGEVGSPLIEKAEIDAKISSGADEAGAYGEDARNRAGFVTRRVEVQRASHGTLVADLACGAGQGGAEDAVLRQMPIFAVDLPTFAVTETSGRRLEPYVARGLRWIVTEAKRMHRPGGPRHPLVVNLSLGSLTGPAEASAFLGELIRDEIRRFEDYTGTRMRVVVAYGNERRERLVAQDEVGPGKPLSLRWRLPPDDRTASFLELRATGVEIADLTISLAAPGEGWGLSDVPWPEAGQVRVTPPRAGSNWSPLAMLAGDGALATRAEPKGPSLLLAVAPTEGFGPGALALPGAWRIEVGCLRPGARVVARVQRDASLPGHRPAGRQSRLESGVPRDWSDETRDWTAPGQGDPVTTKGTGAAYAGPAGQGMILVGAAKKSLNGGIGPTLYSGEGAAAVGSEGPDLVAVSEQGSVQSGRLGPGRLSGSFIRGRGTSIAAPLVTRRLLLAFWRHGPAMNLQQQQQALYGPNGPTTKVDPRMGQGVLPELWP